MTPDPAFQDQAKTSLAAERRFFAWLSLAILTFAVMGFTRTYFLVPIMGLPPDSLPPSVLVHVHAAISFAWCILLVVQSGLVVAGHTRQHRKLGLLGFALYLGLVVTGPVVAIRSVVRYGSPPDELAFLAVSLGNVLAYSLILGAAFHWRQIAAIHKRLMMMGMVVLLTAPFGRLIDLPYQLAHVVGPGLVVLALAIWDHHALGKAHFVTSTIGPAVLIWELVPNLYMHSGWWLTFAQWLVGVAA